MRLYCDGYGLYRDFQGVLKAEVPCALVGTCRRRAPACCWHDKRQCTLYRRLKRAGLDYWPFVVVRVHDDWAAFHHFFRQQVQQQGRGRLIAFSKFGKQPHTAPGTYQPGDWLLFGAETSGLPDEVRCAVQCIGPEKGLPISAGCAVLGLRLQPDNVLQDLCLPELPKLESAVWLVAQAHAASAHVVRIPMSQQHVRSLNLAVSVGVGVYEAVRQLEEHTGVAHEQMGAPHAVKR